MNDAQMGPLEYGNCQGLEMARSAADCARRDDLRGMYPSACVVLDMYIARLHAINEALRKDAERYRWLRDVGSLTWIPFRSQWRMDAVLCDATIDVEMARSEAIAKERA